MATNEIYPLSLHDALPIYSSSLREPRAILHACLLRCPRHRDQHLCADADGADRKSTRLNSSHSSISYAVFCLKKKIRRVIRTNHKKASKIWRHENIQLGGCQSCRLFPRQIRANTISFSVFPEIVPSIGNSFINTMKNINHTRSSISDDIRNILCSSANMRRAIPLILRLLMN